MSDKPIYKAKVVGQDGRNAKVETDHPERHCQVLFLTGYECDGGLPMVGTEGTIRWISERNRGYWRFTPNT